MCEKASELYLILHALFQTHGLRIFVPRSPSPVVGLPSSLLPSKCVYYVGLDVGFVNFPRPDDLRVSIRASACFVSGAS